MGRCILHGRVRANRSLWRVRNRLHAGSGRFPCPVRRPETPSASACSTQGGDTAGITHGAATLGSRTGVRPVTAYHGRSSNPMRGMPDQRRTGMQARRSSPTQQWEESPWSPRATIAQSAGVTAETADPRVVGTVSGIRPKTVAPVESCSEASGYSRRIAVRDGMTGAAPVGVFRRIRGAGAPHRHTMTDNHGVTQGREHPAHRGPSGWMVAYAGSGTPGRRPAGVTAARPPCGGRSGFESRGGRRRPYDPLSDDPIRAVRVPPSDDGTLTALFHELFSAGYRDACRRG